MLGVRDVKVTGKAEDRIPQVVQDPPDLLESVGALLATRAWPALARALPLHDPGLRKVLNTRDTFRRVCNILSGRCRGDPLQTGVSHPESIGRPAQKLNKDSASVLQSLNSCHGSCSRERLWPRPCWPFGG